MSETLTDEQILGLDDGPSSEVSSESSAEVPESSAPIEQEQVSEETQLDQPESIAGKPQQQAGKPQDKTQQPTKPGTPEQQQETIAAKAAELDRADAAFANGDVQGMAETFEQLFGQNPAGLTDAMWMASRFLEQRSPEQFAQFSKMIVSDQLSQLGVKWETLVKLAGYLEKANDRETFEDLNKLAVFFKQVGHGPVTSESQSSAVQGYTSQIGAMMDRSIPALIRSTIGESFSSVQPHMQTELLTAARLDLREMLLKDPKLVASFKKLGEKFSEKEGVRIYLEELAPRLRSLVPLVAKRIFNENRELFKAMPARPQPAKPVQAAKPAIAAPRSYAEASARKMSMADILKATEGEIANGSFLTQEDANDMSEQAILDSPRIPQHRKPWRPENELDKL